MHRFDLIAGYVKGKHLVATDSALLNAASTGYYNKELPLGVVPMLSLGNAGF